MVRKRPKYYRDTPILNQEENVMKLNLLLVEETKASRQGWLSSFNDQ